MDYPLRPCSEIIRGVPVLAGEPPVSVIPAEREKGIVFLCMSGANTVSKAAALEGFGHGTTRCRGGSPDGQTLWTCGACTRSLWFKCIKVVVF